VLKAVACRPLHFAPGAEWRYSNSNYLLLAMVIRKITGKPYGEFLKERIFQPLCRSNKV
jgi:D-alanyl-D-alanine carboxypeptidase